MPNTAADSERYLDATQYSVDRFFTTFVAQQALLLKLRNDLDRIESARQIQHDVFVDRDQWSVNANYLYVMYIKRLQQLDAAANAIGRTQQEQLETALAQLAAR